MKVLVAGGAGFIGSTLVDRLLAEGHAVDVVDDLSTGSMANLSEARADRGNELRFHRLDICEPGLADLLQRSRPDVVFHLAGPAAGDGGDPARVLQVAGLGTLRLLEAARLVGARKVVATVGSTGLYARPTAAELPVKESHPMAPWNIGGVADRTRIDLLRLFRDEHDVEFTALALASVYGPRQQPGRLVASFVARSVAGEAPVVHGDGHQTRDLVFVDDVVDALVRAAERGSGLVINVGTGVETSVADVLRVVRAEVAASDPAAPVSDPARGGDVARLALDPGRAAIHLGWKPWTMLPEGVALAVAAAS